MNRSSFMLVLIAAMLAQSAAAAGGPPLRFAVVASTTVDGKAEDAGPFEALLSEALLKKGLRTVDAERAEKVRRHVSADDALAGKLPPGLSSVDADWVVGATATCKTFVTELRPSPTAAPEKISSSNCDATLSVVRLDTGDVAGKASLFGKAPAASGREAVRRALEKISREFLEKHADALIARASERRPVAMWLFGADQRALVDELREKISKLSGIQGVTLVEFGPELSRLEVTLSAGTGIELARALEEAPALALKVERASGGRISARYDPARPFHTLYWVKPFEDRTRNKRLERTVRLAGDFLGSLLANAPYMSRADDPKDATLVFTGRATQAGGQVRFEVRALSADGKEVAKAAAAGLDALEKAHAELDRLLPARLAALSRTRAGWAAPFAKLPEALEQSRRVQPLGVTKVDAPDLFPAQVARYVQEQPVATVFLERRNGRPIDALTVRAELAGFSAAPRQGEPVRVGGTDSVGVPVYAALDAARLLSLTQATVGQLKVELLWSEGGVERAQNLAVPVRLHERSAIDWSQPASAAAFVTPRDEAIKSAVAAALGGGQGGARLPRQVERAVRITEALASFELRYTPDPVLPFGKEPTDFVNFPHETLALRTGDCDDLSVLAAAGLEAAGISTRLVTTPGHILVAFDSGVPFDHAEEVSFDRGRVLEVDGRAFIPLEATAITGGYVKAWEEGAREVGRHAGTDKLELIDVRKGWLRHPAAAPPGLKEVSLPAQAAVSARADQAMVAVAAAREASLERRLAEVDSRLKKAPADPTILHERAFVLAVGGRLREAEELARPLARSDARARLTLANVLALRGNPAAAEKQLAEGLAAVAGQPAVAAAYHQNLAVVRMLQNNEEGAAASLAQALSLDPGVARSFEDEGPASARAADAATPAAVLKTDLSALLKKAQQRVDSKLGETKAGERTTGHVTFAGRRGEDPDSRQLVAIALRWLPPSR